jgi:hypothetical protein
VAAGVYHLGNLTVHCCSYCNCTTDLTYTQIGLYDDWGNDVTPITADDGTWTCGEDAPNLIVESVKLNPGYSGSYDDYYFANESNTVRLTIKNVGTVVAAASHTRVTGASGNSTDVAVGALNPGASQTVDIVDTVARPVAEVVNAVADCNSNVTECDETDNMYEISSDDTWHDFPGTVINHGLKGKRWTGGDDIVTEQTDTGCLDLVYSVGDSQYTSGSPPGWDWMNVTWTANDLLIPGGATVVKARLYAIYTWDKETTTPMPDCVDMWFDDAHQEPEDAHYTDRKGFGTNLDYENPYGMLVYNVTDDFDASGNYANLSNTAGNQVSMRGMVLMVIYEGRCKSEKLIFVNEGFDILYGKDTYGVNLTEATAWAPLTGATIDMANLFSAKLITIAPGANPNEGNLIFKNATGETTWLNVWNFAGSTEIGIDERDVTGLLTSTGNEVGFQSDADWMEASNAFLVVEYGDPLEFGDAPDLPYPSCLISDGARHFPTDTEYLGLQSAGDGKDFEPDANIIDLDLFDDGLRTFVLTAGNPAHTVDFEVTNLDSLNPNLIVNILVDLNQNGIWDPGEHVVQNQPINLPGPAEGIFTSTPFSTVGAVPGSTWMRITLTRWSSIAPGWDGTMASAGYAGPFECGETEDWSVTIEDDGPGGTCGDVDGIPGVTMNDGRQIFMNIIYGSAQYPISDPWAADCDGLCDGMTMNDGRQIFMNIIYGSAQYPLNCTCP